ncbi:unnamed protein product, partial [Sphacelaria rigidula]
NLTNGSDGAIALAQSGSDVEFGLPKQQSPPAESLESKTVLLCPVEQEQAAALGVLSPREGRVRKHVREVNGGHHSLAQGTRDGVNRGATTAGTGRNSAVIRPFLEGASRCSIQDSD